MTDRKSFVRSSIRRSLKIFVPVLVVYFVAAYFLLPSIWRHYEHQKKLDGLPMVTATAQGIPADPINLGIVGSSKDILCAMRDAGWYAADPITWRSSLDISRSVIFDQPYPTAPVSNLFYAGRAEDLAFEKPAGKSADQRNHIRCGRFGSRAAKSVRSGLALRHSTGAWASAAIPARSPTTLPRTSMRNEFS